MAYDPLNLDTPQPTQAAPVAQQPVSTSNTPENVSAQNSLLDKVTGNIQAAATGVYHGMDTFATGLLKVMVQDPGKKQMLQTMYNGDTQDYNKQYDQHPVAAGLGNFAGGLIATAPLALIPGAQGAGISSAKALGALLTNTASGAAQGALLGGIATHEGQDPQEAFSISGATSGAFLGGTLQGAGSAILSKYLGNTTNLENAQNTMMDALGTTPSKLGISSAKVMSTDVNNNGLSDTLNNYIANNVLSKLPGWMGTNGPRELQNQQVQQAMQNYIQKFTTDTTASGPQQWGQMINNHYSQLKGTEDGLWKDAVSKMPDEAITPQATNLQSNNLIQQYQGVNGSPLTPTMINTLKQGTSDMTPSQLLDFKRNIFSTYSQIQNKANFPGSLPIMSDVANQFKQLYWTATNDLKEGLGPVATDVGPSQSTEALQAYNKANTFSRTLNTAFDPAARPEMMKALVQGNNDASAASAFQKQLLGNSISPQEVGVVQQNLLGQAGTRLTQGAQLQKIYDKSFTNDATGNPVFNIKNFLSGINQVKNTPQANLMQPAVDGLSGLTQYMQNIAQPVANAGRGMSVGNALGVEGMFTGAGVMAGGVSGAGLAAATPLALSTIYRNSPVKNSFIALNRIMGQGGLTQNTTGAGTVQNFLQSKIADQLGRIGVLMKPDASGAVTAYHQSEVNNFNPLSMNQGPTATTGMRN